MNKSEELYLASYEYEDFFKPRKIISYKKIYIDNREIILAEVNKPILGQEYGYDNIEFRELYLLGRFRNDLNLEHLPLEVHVMVPKKKFIEDNLKKLDNLFNIGWACIYDNVTDAKEHKFGK